MVNEVSSALNLIMRQFKGVNQNVLQTQGLLNQLKTGLGRAVLGAGLVAGGAAILGGVVHMVKASEELNNAQTRWRNAGLDQKAVAEATGEAWRITGKNAGIAVGEAMDGMLHLRQMLADPAELNLRAPETGRTVAEEYMRSAVALQQITGLKGEDQAYQLARTIDITAAANVGGKFNAAEFAKQQNFLTAQIAALGGKINARDELQFAQHGGSYAANIMASKDKDGFSQGWTHWSGLMGILGGSQAGTVLTQVNRSIKDGAMFRKSFDQLEKFGLYDMSKVHFSKGFMSLRTDPGALKGENLFKSDLVEWAHQVLNPALAKKGITSTEQQVDAVQHTGLNSSVTKALVEIERNSALLDREASNVRIAQKVNQYDQTMGSNVSANFRALGVAWHNFESALGITASGGVVKILQSLTSAIQGATSWAVAHQSEVGSIMKWAGIIGAGMVAIGAALIVSATPFLWVPLAFGAAAALLLGAGTAIASAPGKIMSGLAHFVTSLTHGALEALNKVAPGLTKMLRGLGHLLGPMIAWGGRMLMTVGKIGLDVLGGVAKLLLGLGVGALKIADGFMGLLGSMLDGLARFFGGITQWIGQHLPWLANAFHAVAGGGPAPQAKGATAPGSQPQARTGPDTSKLPKAGDVHVTVNTTTNVDGKQVAQTVTKHLAQAASGPVAGRTGYNPQMTPSPGAGR